MVFLVVKGTKHPDEFVYECDVKAKCVDVAATVAAIQNTRIRVKNQLFSWNDLLPAAKKATKDESIVNQLTFLMEEISASLKNAKAVVPEGMYERYWGMLRDYVVQIFPNECVVKAEPAPAATSSSSTDASAAATAAPPLEGDAVHEAAISRLYELHDNPDLDEDYRLHIYHCRTILDPLWRINEQLNVAKGVSLWFNGKSLKGSYTIGKLCNDNNKSRVTVKVALKDGGAPALEPTIDYNAQRELRKVFLEKREVMSTLEESEMRDVIAKQAKAKLKFGSSMGLPSGGGADKLSLPSESRGGLMTVSGVSKEETIVQGNE